MSGGEGNNETDVFAVREARRRAQVASCTAFRWRLADAGRSRFCSLRACAARHGIALRHHPRGRASARRSNPRGVAPKCAFTAHGHGSRSRGGGGPRHGWWAVSRLGAVRPGFGVRARRRSGAGDGHPSNHRRPNLRRDARPASLDPAGEYSRLRDEFVLHQPPRFPAIPVSGQVCISLMRALVACCRAVTEQVVRTATTASR